MDNEAYLAYIAHFVDSVSPNTPKYEYREYFSEVLGDDLFDSDTASLKKLARHLYKSYVCSVYSRHNAFVLARKLTDSQLEKYLAEIIELDKKYKIDYTTIDKDLKSSDFYIQKSGERKWKFILGKLDPKNSPTIIKEKARKEREAKKPAAKPSTKPRAKSSVRDSPKPPRKPASKHVTVKKTKTCSEHNIKELKEIAKARGLTGYSKLNKADLCQFLKIK